MSRFLARHAEAVADVLDERIAVRGQVVVVDLHCYVVGELPYQRYHDARPPALSVGVDVDVDVGHIPQALLELVSLALSVVGEVAVNEPFRRTHLAIHHLGRDNKVISVMLEPRRDTYLLGDGGAWIRKETAGSVRLVAILRPEHWAPEPRPGS